jgi:hypothetical protein
MVVLVTRDGPGLDDGDYVNMSFNGALNRLTEGKSRNQIELGKTKQTEGFVVNDDQPVSF